MMYVNFSSMETSDMTVVTRIQLIEVTANKIFKTPHKFDDASVMIFVRGVARTKGENYDYITIGDDQVEIKCPLENEDNMIISYIKK